MKLVVFAHTPPPMHGQSYMVKLMIEGLRSAAGEDALTVFHVDAKLSKSAQSVGQFRWSKVFLVLKYCLTAWWYRFKHGADTFYYIPAPGKRSALYRDWIVMALCRPIFQRVIFHWHAVGLGAWLESEARRWEKSISHRLLDRADLGIVLSEFGRADAMKFSPNKIDIVSNGIPDPCPNFSESVLPDRQQRHRARQERHPIPFTVLFLGACSAEKGLFVTLDAIELINQRLALDSLRAPIRLIVAGEFSSADEQRQFEQRFGQLNERGKKGMVSYAGFADDEKKYALFRQTDCFCFPTRYPAEGQPVTIIEAFAFGLPVIATRWRGIPDLLTESDSDLIEDQNPSAIADALERLISAEITSTNRSLFLERHQLSEYIGGLKRSFAEA